MGCPMRSTRSRSPVGTPPVRQRSTRPRPRARLSRSSRPTHPRGSPMQCRSTRWLLASANSARYYGGKGHTKEESSVSEQQNRDAIERFFEAFERGDVDVLDDIVHDDYVEEYPQSGARIRGKHNLRAVNENYPGMPTMIEHSYVLSGDLGVMKMTLDYDGNRIYACEIVDFEDGKIKRARAYFAEPFEAPEWRAQWVERM